MTIEWKEEYERLQRLIKDRGDEVWVEPELLKEVEKMIDNLYNQLPESWK